MTRFKLECINCHKECEEERSFRGCVSCRTDDFVSPLRVVHDYERVKNEVGRGYFAAGGTEAGIWRYARLLPVGSAESMVTLHEGSTPLVRCSRLGGAWGLKNLYVKDESRNPTWSFKDRHTCVAISKAKELGYSEVVGSSGGNHAASIAAYAARAGMKGIVITSRTNEVFFTLTRAYSPEVKVFDTSQERSAELERCVRERGLYPMTPLIDPIPVAHPYGSEGYKTMAYEIASQLGFEPPSRLYWPLGVGDGIFGLWMGFAELETLGVTGGVPRLVAAESSACAPLSNALRKGLKTVERVRSGKTVASSIAVSSTGFHSLLAVRDTGGDAVGVDDHEMLSVQLELASKEGMFLEPSSAASLAAAKKGAADGSIDADEVVVCVGTSTGLKDPFAARDFMDDLARRDVPRTGRA